MDGPALDDLLDGRTRVFVEDGPCEPLALAAGLPGGLELHTFFVLSPPPYLAAVLDGRSRLVANFPGRGLRSVPPELVHYPRRSFFGLVRALATNADDVQAVLVRVGPSDADGWCSFGVQASFLPELVALGVPMLAEVDDDLPVVPGASRVPVERLTLLTRSRAPVTELVQRPPGAVDRAIAAHVVSVVPDRPVLQLGIGGLPDAVCEALAGRRGLRVRSGMVSDAVLALGAAFDTSDGPPVEAALLAGSHDLYCWAAGSGHVRLVPSATLHDPNDLAGIERFVAVNSGLEVDLAGNVNTEWSGGATIGGRGGHPDFSEGAHRSVDGVSIVALAARRPDDRPTIVAAVAPEHLSTPGSFVDVVVTEWGVADLRDAADLDERGRRIVAIAHPDDRAALATAGNLPSRREG